MYGIALSVSACLRGGTEVGVAWSLDSISGFDPTDAVAITPGGGRLGSLLGGTIDSRLVELSLSDTTECRIVSVALNEIESSELRVDPGTAIRIFYGPADSLPEPLWDKLLKRQPVALELDLAGDRIAALRLGQEPVATRVRFDGERVVCEWCPRTSLIVFGGGPMADALAEAASFVGWNVEGTGATEAAVALATSLSAIDGIVVMGHDTEAVGRVLQAALASQVGYIGSIGPAHLQEDRGDWLAYRSISDTSRIHGPAGFPIGANSPEEVALSVITEMIAVRNNA